MIFVEKLERIIFTIVFIMIFYYLQIERVDVSGALSHPHHHHQVAEVDDDVLDDGVHLSLLLPPVPERLQVFWVKLGNDRLRLVRFAG